MGIVRKTLIALGLITIALFSVGCGSNVPVDTEGAASSLPTTATGLSTLGNSVSPIVTSLTSPGGLGVSSLSGATAPLTGPLSEPSSLLGGQTPWSYFNSLYPNQASDVFAVVNVGQYSFSFGPSSTLSTTGGPYQYAIQLPAGVEPITNSPGCAQSPTGIMAGPVTVCLTFATVSSTPLNIQLAVNGGGTTVTQNVYVLVLPGGQLLVNGVVGTLPPPVVIDQTIYVSPNNGNSGIQTIPSSFTLQAVSSNGSPASIQSIQVTPASAAELVPNGPVAQVTALQGGPLLVNATVIDSSGNQENIMTQINIPRQLAIRYTMPSLAAPCLLPSYSAFLVCGNSSPIPALATVSSAGGPATPFELMPGSQPLPSQHFPGVRDPQFHFLVANLTLTVDGSVPAGALNCNAVVAGGLGVVRANYGLGAF
jgi:hypothetical protein